ncbi:hypothetical protein GCM10027425_10830 [Alteromonas gracilis]
MRAATATFAAHGYSNSSMRGIAARAGVDPALLHHYFGSKQPLFEAVIQPAYAIRERLVVMAGSRDQRRAPRGVPAVLVRGPHRRSSHHGGRAERL